MDAHTCNVVVRTMAADDGWRLWTVVWHAIVAGVVDDWCDGLFAVNYNF